MRTRSDESMVRRLLSIGPQRLAWYAVWPAFLGGGLLVTYAASVASRSTTGNLQFHLVWIGVFLLLIPVTIVVMSTHTTRAQRFAVILALGVFVFLPKLSIDPTRPVYFDEHAHWDQTARLIDDGQLFRENTLVPIISEYPGLHLMSASIEHLTGLSEIELVVVVLAMTHVLALFGVYLIAFLISDSDRAGGIAALLYGVAPGFWFFNSQFSYQSLGIVTFIWTIAAVVGFLRADGRGTRRLGWFLFGIGTAVATTEVHHLTSVALLLALVLMLGVVTVRTVLRRERRGALWQMALFFGIVLATDTWWLLKEAPGTIEYLSPYLTDGTKEVQALIAGSKKGQKQLFVGSTVPIYERIASFATPALMGLGALVAFLTTRRQKINRSAFLGILLLAGLFFATFPMMFSSSGNEGARRSWTFTSVAVAVLIGIGLRYIPEVRGSIRRRAASIFVVFAMLVSVIGNVAADVNAESRFPGAYKFGADNRSVTAESMAAGRWLLDTQGPDRKVLTDRTMEMQLSQQIRAITVDAAGNFPVWDLYLDSTLPGQDLMDALAVNHWSYFVIDKRQTMYVPQIGFYVDKNEPGSNAHVVPLPMATVTKFRSARWAILVYSSTNLQIWRFDYDAVLAPGADSPVPSTATSPSAATP